mmetsp:Transcript_31952/g.77246  ORF Transcript_31952/g.77246 Transcript_31952/m.77246 type:complete len:478 (+) Transcript_31952:213-1646(+)
MARPFLFFFVGILGTTAIAASEAFSFSFGVHPSRAARSRSKKVSTPHHDDASSSPPSSRRHESRFGARAAAAIRLQSSPSGNTSGDVMDAISSELWELSECASLAYGYLSKPDGEVTAEDVVVACDAADAAAASPTDDGSATLYIDRYLSLRRKSHELGRYHLLVKLLKTDYDAYVKTAEFLSPSRISRGDLPNVQDVAYVDYIASSDAGGERDDDATKSSAAAGAAAATMGEDGQPLVADCELRDLSYDDSPLDKLLLFIFRKLVAENTGGVTSDVPGIKGLLDQGRRYMTRELPEGATYAEDHVRAQHDMVKNTLGGLMTPVLPPFYRIFMAGIVPKVTGTDYDGRQIGPWFYAPWLTSIVTPTFFGFLVGPSRPNRRSDGERGGLVVEKCKFLQESGCKGLCLHQCKIPAQEFFKEELGLELTVKPNFVTQECQWSFGETPLPPEEDPSFPTGCLVGCESRKAMAGRKSSALCM